MFDQLYRLCRELADGETPRNRLNVPLFRRFEHGIELSHATTAASIWL